MPPKRSDSVGEPLTEQVFSQFAKELKAMIKESEQNINSRLKKVEEKFAGIYNKLREDVEEIKEEVSDLKSQVEDVKAQSDGVERSMSFHAAKVDDIEKEQNEKRSQLEESLTEKIKDLNNKLLLLEKHDRKYNLLFNGIEEEQAEKLYDKMRRFFVSNLHIDENRAERIYFSNGHRLPVAAKFIGPKPVIMRFTNYEDRELILSQAFNLAGSNKSIHTDLPVVMKKERQRLAKCAYDIRQKEALKTRIRDKGLEMILEVRKDNHEKWVERKA